METESEMEVEVEEEPTINKTVLVVGIMAGVCLVVTLAALGIWYRQDRTRQKIESMSDVELERYIAENTYRSSGRTVLKLAVEEKKKRELKTLAAENKTAAPGEEGVDPFEPEGLSTLDRADELAQSAGMKLAILLGVILVITLYFLPTYIARRRGHHNQTAIFVANCFFGLTGVVWLWLIVWACSDLEQHRAIMEIHAALVSDAHIR